MNTVQRHAKIKAMIEQETRDVEAGNYAEYMNTVLLTCSILKTVAEDGKIDEMPRQQILDIIDAIGSTLTFNRELLIEVQKLLRTASKQSEPEQNV